MMKKSDGAVDKPVTAESERIYARSIKSYARRTRGITERQKNALTQLWSKYGLSGQEVLDLSAVFDREVPCILEIGFGNGETLAETAKQYPQYDFLGMEVHRSGLGHLLHLAEEKGLANLRVMEGDAVQLLQKCIPDDSLGAIHIFFPDPWPKSRHHKRRLIQSDFVSLLANKLTDNGVLHLATDWEDYAHHMRAVMNAAPAYAAIAEGESSLLLERPLTKFEKRGLRLGHTVSDLSYIKKPFRTIT